MLAHYWKNLFDLFEKVRPHLTHAKSNANDYFLFIAKRRKRRNKSNIFWVCSKERYLPEASSFDLDKSVHVQKRAKWDVGDWTKTEVIMLISQRLLVKH